MSEATKAGEGKPKAKPDADAQTPDARSDTPAAVDAKRQNKQKDKPDSGQNEDG